MFEKLVNDRILSFRTYVVFLKLMRLSISKVSERI